MRLAILFDNFGPYHVARIQGAHDQNLEVLGVEACHKSSVYAWEEPKTPDGLNFVKLGLTRKSSRDEILASLNKSFSEFDPEVIAVPGWSTSISIIVIEWSLARGIPIVLMSESNEFDFKRHSLSEWIKCSIVKLCSAGLTGGVSGGNYLVSLGLPKDSVFMGYNAINNYFFESRAKEVKLSLEMPNINNGNVLSKKFMGRYFLSSCRFIDKKNLSNLLIAYSKYRLKCKKDEAWPLVILGDGDLREALEMQIEALGLSGSVHLPGFRQYEDLSMFYATAGAFVHASTIEQWGLVVNEAMASGLPVVASNRCGCVEMLVLEGETGFIFDPFDIDSITDALGKISNHPDIERLGVQAQELISLWGIDRFGDGILKASKIAFESKRVNLRYIDKCILHLASLLQSLKN